MSEPTLPQGAGYGVGTSVLPPQLSPFVTEYVCRANSRRCVSSPRYRSLRFPEWGNAGIGLFFSAFMVGLTAIQTRYTGFSPKSADEFNSASRSVKPGLIAAGIVSAWTWAATLVCLSLEFRTPYSRS